MECNPLCQAGWFECALLMMEPWQNSIKQSTQQGGKKKEQKKGPKCEPKEHNPKGVALLQFVNKIISFMELRAGSVEISSVCHITMEFFPYFIFIFIFLGILIS